MPPQEPPATRDRCDAHGDRTAGRTLALLLVLLVAQLMVILDITAVNIALPEPRRATSSSAARTISWTITSYSLDLRKPAPLRRPRRRPARTPPAVPDRPRRLHRVVARLGARRARADALFAARAGQGLGAAMLSPAALSIITTAFQGTQRAKALAASGAVGGAGAAMGVLVGGHPHRVRRLADDLLREPAGRAGARRRRGQGHSAPTSRSRAGVGSMCAVRCRHGEPGRARLCDHAGCECRPELDSDGRFQLSAASSGSPRSRPREARTERPLLTRRAARGSRGRRGALPDGRRRRVDLRAVLSLLGLPPERARNRAADDRPRVHPARARGRDRRTRRRAHRRPPRRADAPRVRVRDRRRRDGPPRARR